MITIEEEDWMVLTEKEKMRRLKRWPWWRRRSGGEDNHDRGDEEKQKM